MDEKQPLPERLQALVFPDQHSRGLNHILDLFGVVHGAIPEDNEQALWSLREILHRYGEYHGRALACEHKNIPLDSACSEICTPDDHSIFCSKRPKVFCTDRGCPPTPGEPGFDHLPGCFWGSPKTVIMPVYIDDE